MDRSQAGRDRLAVALAGHFGLDEQAVRGFLTSGRRLRARSGLDEDDARSLVSELETLGAVVAVDPPLSVSKPTPVYESGLAAARPDAPAAELGALGRDDSLTIASLDGEVIETESEGAAEALSRPISVSVPPVPVRPPPPPVSGPVTPPKIEFRTPQRPVPSTPVAPIPPVPPRDPFAPPVEALQGEIELVYQPRQPRQSRPETSAQVPIAVGSGPHPTSPEPVKAPPPSVETLVLLPEPPPKAPVQTKAVSRPVDRRVRLALALAGGLVVGFFAAHLYASSAEDKLDEIRLELLHDPAAQNGDEYQQALERHQLAKSRMERTKQRIELAAGFLWLAVGAGVAYAALRFMPTKVSS